MKCECGNLAETGDTQCADCSFIDYLRETQVMEQYLMAFGLAVTLGADDQFAHLFARNFDATTNVELASMQVRFDEFKSHPNYIANNAGRATVK